MQKVGSKIAVSITLVIAVIFIFLIFSGKILNPKIVYDTYSDDELGFLIDYPSDWKIEKGILGDNTKDPYVIFSGQIKRKERSNSKRCKQWYDPGIITVKKSIMTEPFLYQSEDEVIEEFYPGENKNNTVIEKIELNNDTNLIISEAGGVSMCYHGLYEGVAFDFKNKTIFTIHFDGGEDRYDVIEPVFKSFKILSTE